MNSELDELGKAVDAAVIAYVAAYSKLCTNWQQDPAIIAAELDTRHEMQKARRAYRKAYLADMAAYAEYYQEQRELAHPSMM
jgi:hypothetical protein